MASLKAPANHNPQEDAEAVRKAVEGWGTNEGSITMILGRRNASQRQQIRKAYEEIYKEDLVHRLENELKGDFERAMYRWMLEPSDRDAVLANVAIKKEKEFHVIVELGSVLSSEELIGVRRAYHHRYKHSLEEEIADRTTGHLRQLLVGMVSSFRYEGKEIDEKVAMAEAEVLHEAIKCNKDKLEDAITILCLRSKPQLAATFNKYREKHGTSPSKQLTEEKGDDFLKALHTAIRCIADHKKYYEKVLRNAMNGWGVMGLGTDEDDLTRIVVTRAEKDLKEIKELYYKKNNANLEDHITKNTSGDYKKFLLTLLGKEDA